PDPLASRLAALPLIDPPGGWSGALDLWKRKALLSVGSTGGASAAVSGGGVIFMSTKWIWAAGIAVAVGLGFVGGRTSLDFFRSRPSSADVSDARSSAADVVASDLEATVDRLEAENRELRRDRDARRAEAERLSSELAAVSARVDTMDKTASGGGPPHGPVFTFGVSGQLEAVHEANWPEIADSSQRIAEDVREILSYQESGEKPPRELLIHLQEHTERVRKYEYRTIGKLPTAGRHNGELTHPISLTNTFAQILETAGAPLTPEQIARIEALGLSFETEFERLRSGYSEGTPRVERLLDEYSLKGAFVDDLYAVLTAAQRGIVVDEETQRIAGLDLYCPTLLIIHTSPVVQGATLEEIVGKMKTLLTQSLELSTDEVAALDSPLSQWAQDIAGLLEPVTAAHATHYHYDEGAQAGRATVALYRSMLREVPLDEASRARLLDDYAFYIPRIVPAPPQG
ncbi:MAG: hypothetical protein KDC38_09830, partial [Planctomycetes bacterium]|nr:hypothetical protein [Planctomycetota bacterium]